ncbi:diaminobutyrate acetyltransferase [Phaeobacter sp. HF9A]|uniref:diaminobutyrate acetyltransferase n=1 Tax=Phaeobacter sp. HF9A TaxID=2721561 RepID=UPI001431327E|nr:diaminobutyrate acetyltransferase [Phaeobacter sp. HF9A]NIZ15567.1 diaminobutyrate acetyltransferase [Phaeobacter sp. HF9A]
MPKDILNPDTPADRTRQPLLRKPNATDGAAIWELVKACAPLDRNSMYANLIQADHFRDTCVAAELDGEIVGWISGHMIPGQDVFFVWQVAVADSARGMGLGKKMLHALLARRGINGATALQTTITKDNAASWGLFRSFARDIGAELSDAPHFEKEAHFDGAHDTEHMVTIPLESVARILKRAA